MTRYRFASVLWILCMGLAPLVQAAPPVLKPIAAAVDPATVAPGATTTLTITTEIPDGFHSQSHTPSAKNYIPFKVTFDPTDAATFDEPTYPKGEDHNYGEPLGTLNIYEGKVEVTVVVHVKPDAPAGDLALAGKVQLQMCDDKACYPPKKPTFSATVKVAGAPVAQTTATAPTPTTNAAPTTQASATTAASAAPTGGDSSGSDTGVAAYTPSSVTSLVKGPEWSILTALGAAFLAGLLFNVMPCVLPVIPIKAIGFYEVSQHNRARSFTLGLVFSAGMISVFALLSLIVLVFKFVSWGELFSKGWFIWCVIVPLFAVMGFGLLGGWNFSLPVGVYRLEARHDTIGGNFFWGALTAVFATPCTAPLLPTLLIWASSRPGFIGVLAMIVVGVGMAFPYLLLSAMPELARKMPRAGPWSELFKQMSGLLMIAAAVFFAAGRLVHGPEFFWYVVFVIAIASFYLVARSVQISDKAGPVGVATTIAVAMLAGSLWWTCKVTGIGSPMVASASSTAHFTPFTEAAFKSARTDHKPVLVKFTANWCSTCQVIEGTVFRNPKIWDALSERGYEVLKVDFSETQDVPGHELLLALNPAGGIPLTAIFPGNGADPIVLSSVYDSEELLTALNQATPNTRVASR